MAGDERAPVLPLVLVQCTLAAPRTCSRACTASSWASFSSSVASNRELFLRAGRGGGRGRRRHSELALRCRAGAPGRAVEPRAPPPPRPHLSCDCRAAIISACSVL